MFLEITHKAMGFDKFFIILSDHQGLKILAVKFMSV